MMASGFDNVELPDDKAGDARRFPPGAFRRSEAGTRSWSSSPREFHSLPKVGSQGVAEQWLPFRARWRNVGSRFELAMTSQILVRYHYSHASCPHLAGRRLQTEVDKARRTT